MIQFHNTLTRNLESFTPAVDGKVGLYTCGPTVYAYAHIGNFRTFVWEDLLRRFLEARGFAVHHVMNITDVDDKIIAAAVAAGVGLEEFTAPFTKAFFEDLETLNIRRAHVYPRATEHIAEMQTLLERLRTAGLAYASDGSVYFRISRFSPYGQLSGKNPGDLKAGASGRVDADEYEKDDVRDFALWKAAPDGGPSWPGPDGPGRPGWHIECSAMSMKYLGESFDIHTGGVDNIFPHHENEIAQSQGATGLPLARYWLHAAHLIVNGEKMSKSLGNFHTLRHLLARGVQARTLRYLLLSIHYRRVLDLSDDAMTAARQSLERLDEFASRLAGAKPGARPEDNLTREAEAHLLRFHQSLDDDLNVAAALGSLFEMVRVLNGGLDRSAAGETALAAGRGLLSAFREIFGITLGRCEAGLDAELQALVDSREEARRSRDFAEADRLRQKLLERGVILEDTPAGTRWKKTEA